MKPLIPGKVWSVHYVMFKKDNSVWSKVAAEFAIEEGCILEPLRISLGHQNVNGIVNIPYLPLNSSYN